MVAVPTPETHRRPSFVLEEHLGRGSQAEVFRSFLPGVGAVAVKEFSGREPCTRALARREAQWLRWLDHPGVPTLHVACLDEGLPALAMELFDGVSLHTLRQRNRCTPTALPCWLLAHVGAGVARVLDHCWTHQPRGHAAPLRVVHGDLKPGNVMLCADGRVAVIDFGVATSAHESDAVRTAAGGTLRYFSPQRLLGAAATPADDCYALGASLLSTALGGTRVAAHPDPVRHAQGVGMLLGSLPSAYGALRPVLEALLVHDPERRLQPAGLQAVLQPFCPPQRLVSWSAARLVREAPRPLGCLDQEVWGSLPTANLQGSAA